MTDNILYWLSLLYLGIILFCRYFINFLDKYKKLITRQRGKVGFLKGGTGMAQWWEHLPPSNVAPNLILGLGVICGLSLLLVLVLAPRGFSPVFPSPQKPTFSNSSSLWIQWMKNHLVHVLLLSPVYLVITIYFI